MSWTVGVYFLLALALVAAAAVALWAHLRYWVARLTLSLEYSDVEVLTAGDGARIEIRRLPRASGAHLAPEDPELPPVLLVHGLAANHRNQDIHPDYSLARYLAALGRDVWLLTLRSGRVLSADERRTANFAAMAGCDLPCAVDAVLARTGQRRLDYVGFSMGGMLLYAALGRSVAAERLRRAVTVGSPGRLSRATRLMRFFPQRLMPGVPLRFLARSVAFASEWARTPLHHAVANPRNFPPGVTRLSLVNCIEDIPAALNADFLAWAAADGEIRIDGERVLDGLASISVPAMFIAGCADRVAPVASVRAAFEAWARSRPDTHKQLLLLGREFGAIEDYGHGDLAMGARAATELFEPIARFLAAPEQAAEPAGVVAAMHEGDQPGRSLGDAARAP